jgi:hypothetical protein
MAAVTAAVIGIGTGVYSAVQGFSNAAKQKRLAEEADAAAAEAIADAKSKASVDYYESLSVPLDAYESEFEANLQGQTQAIEALQEGDQRALAAGVGKIGAQQQALNEQTRIAMGEEISDLNMMKAESKDAINQQLIEMDVAAAKEQNQRMRDAQIARADSIQQGISGLSQVATSGAELAPLYGNTSKAPKGTTIQQNAKGEEVSVRPGYDADGFYSDKKSPWWEGKFNFKRR